MVKHQFWADIADRGRVRAQTSAVIRVRVRGRVNNIRFVECRIR